MFLESAGGFSEQFVVEDKASLSIPSPEMIPPFPGERIFSRKSNKVPHLLLR